jgi:hypothetical protein
LTENKEFYKSNSKNNFSCFKTKKALNNFFSATLSYLPQLTAKTLINFIIAKSAPKANLSNNNELNIKQFYLIKVIAI